MPKISVIVPVYNSEKYLHRCIESLINQTLTDIEIILINDASTDNSYEILCEYQKTDTRIKVINCEKNGRQGTARNKGIKASTSKWIYFVDSDDWIDLELLEKNYASAETTNADMVGSLAYLAKSNTDYSLSKDVKVARLLPLCNHSLSNTEKNYLFLYTAGVCSSLFKRKIIMDNHIFFPEGLAYEDNYFVKLYCLYVERYAFINEPLYYYYQNPFSTIHKEDGEHHFDRLKIELMKLDEFQARGFYEIYYDAICIDFIKLYYLNTIGLFFNRFTKVPYKKIIQMKKIMLDQFPDYKNTKYYRSYLNKADHVKLCLATISPYLLYLPYKLKRKKG